jgi:hypothetical protein
VGSFFVSGLPVGDLALGEVDHVDFHFITSLLLFWLLVRPGVEVSEALDRCED